MCPFGSNDDIVVAAGNFAGGRRCRCIELGFVYCVVIRFAFGNFGDFVAAVIEAV